MNEIQTTNRLSPYLMFNGTCEAAMNFYKEVLDGSIDFMGRFSESPDEVPEEHKDKIMHASLTFSGGTIMASDHVDAVDYTSAPVGSNVHLSIGFASVDELQLAYEKLSGGGAITMELQDTFWGDRFGMVTDQFGIQWMLSGPRIGQ